MRVIRSVKGLWGVLATLFLGFGVAGCSTDGLEATDVPGAQRATTDGGRAKYDYVIGPGDDLTIFVWRNPELSQSVPVKPDGTISVPLVEDLPAAGKTSTQLAREIEQALSRFVKEPLVTVIVQGFQGIYEKQIRVVGQAATPQAIPYRANMTVLDVMIAVGGLTEFAAGNRTRLIRTSNGQRREMTVRLDDLLRDGDVTANIAVTPGDILIIPEAWF